MREAGRADTINERQVDPLTSNQLI